MRWRTVPSHDFRAGVKADRPQQHLQVSLYEAPPRKSPQLPAMQAQTSERLLELRSFLPGIGILLVEFVIIGGVCGMVTIRTPAGAQ